MILLNFSHPLTGEQVTQIEALAGQPVDQVRDVMPQLELGAPFVPQVEAQLEQVGLSAHEWQTVPLLVVLPGYAPAAAVLLASLHGRMGHFPAVVRLRAVEGSLPPRYEIAELINLQNVRDRARRTRQE